MQGATPCISCTGYGALHGLLPIGHGGLTSLELSSGQQSCRCMTPYPCMVSMCWLPHPDGMERHNSVCVALAWLGVPCLTWPKPNGAH